MAGREKLRRPSFFRFVILCVSLLLVPADGYGVGVTVTWAPNPPEDGVVGYVLCYGSTPRAAAGFTQYDVEFDVGAATEYRLALPDDVPRWYFAVISYDSERYESGYAPEYRWSAAAEYFITAKASSGGAIVPEGKVWIPPGDSQAFAFSPAPGFVISDVKVDGVSVGTVSGYTFTDVTADHTVEATFTQADEGGGAPEEADLGGSGGGGGGCFLSALR